MKPSHRHGIFQWSRTWQVGQRLLCSSVEPLVAKNASHVVCSLALLLALFSADARAQSLAVVADRAVYLAGDVVTLTVVGDSGGEVGIAIFGKLNYSAAHTWTIGAVQTPHTSLNGSRSWVTGGLDSGDGFSVVFSQICCFSPPNASENPIAFLPLDQEQIATLTLVAERPGVVNVEFDDELEFFGVDSALVFGTAFTVLPNPNWSASPHASASSSGSGSASSSFGYDDLNRLASVMTSGQSSGVGYAYDAAGNRASVLPEPGSWLSLGLGLLIVMLLHRRRRALARTFLVAGLALAGLAMGAPVPAHAQSAPRLEYVDRQDTVHIHGTAPAPAAAAQSQATAAATQASSSTEVTPEIAELARALRYDVDLIYEYVYTQITYEPMWASNKGALGTLLDRSGNDFDQASLMIALLRESGYTASFVYGQLSYSGAELANWMQGPTQLNAFSFFLARTGRETNNASKNEVFPGAGSTVASADIERVWVKVDIGGTNYVFDPAFKTHTITPGINLATAMGYSRSALVSGATSGAVIDPDYIQNVNTANLEASLTTYTNNLITEIDTNHPGARLGDIIGGATIEPVASSPRVTSFPNQNQQFAEWTGDIPAAFRSTLRVRHIGIDETFYSDALAGRRLTIFYGSSQPVLRLDGVTIATGNSVAVGSNQQLLLTPTNAFTNPVARTWAFQIEAGGSFFILNGFSRIGEGRVRHHEGRERAETFANGGLLSEPVLGESLGVFAALWLAESTLTSEMSAEFAAADWFHYSSVGVTGQVASPYLDIASLVAVSADNNSNAVKERVIFASAGHSSVLEGGAIEQIQPDGGAVSTVELVGIANDSSQRLFDATSSNYNSIKPQLSGYSNNDLTTIEALINLGDRLLLPQNGSLTADQWSGAGYLAMGTNTLGYLISGTLKGAFGTSNYTLDVQTFYQPQPVSHNQSFDPIDLVTGDFLLDAVDLTVGSQPYPLGLNLQRSYNSGSRYRDGPFGLGWTHNFDLTARTSSDGFQALGKDSPVDAAAAIVELFVTVDLLSGSSFELQAHEHTVLATLAQRWFIRQLTDNVVTVVAPSNTSVFTRLPDGSFNPPPGSAAMLSVEPDGSYLLTTKHGTELDYDVDGKLTSWQDLNGNTVDFSYSGDNLQSVSADTSHTLTFSYSGDRISSISDGTRSYSYGYDTAGNLTSVTDANNEDTTFQYQSDGLLSEVFTPAHPTNANVTNTYNALGRMETQLDPLGNTYSYFIAPGVRSEEVDPASEVTIAYYDERGKTIREIDALGYETISEYDGEERLVYAEAPEGNAIEFEYDDRHNRILERRYPKTGSPLTPIVRSFTYHPVFNRVASATDPRNATTDFTYDSNGNLIQIDEPFAQGGSPVTTFTHNSRGQVATTTDPEGTVTRYIYNASTADLLSTTEDLGGLSLLTVFTYNTAGDRATVTDPRQNTATFTYDSMRRLTQTESPAPFNYLTKFSHDPNGRVTKVERQIGTPAPWQTTTTTYTRSGKVKTVTEPGHSTSTVHFYDVRDQLASVTNAKGQTTTYEYDERGALKKVIDAMITTSEEYTYTPNGQQASVKDANGNLTGFRYDAFDRLEFTDYPGGTSEQRGYDPASNLTSRVTRAGETITYAYNALNRLRVKTPSGSPAVWFTYDLAGRITETTNGSGTTFYTYDALGRRNTVTDPNNRVVDVDYDAAGNRSQLTYPDGYYVTYDYDEMNRLTAIRDPAAASLASYSYDRLSRPVLALYGNGTSAAYTHELDDDLSRVAHQFNGSAAAFDYVHDAVHNRTRVDMSDSRYAFDLANLADTTYTVNNLNQYPSLVEASVSHSINYDTNGNLVDHHGGATYTYDSENQLVDAAGQTTSVQYEYNAFGIRTRALSASGDTYYVLDGIQVIAEYASTGASIAVRRYVYAGLDQPIQMHRPSTSGTFVYHQDALGSVVALTNASGGLAESYAYGPYGQVDQPSSLGNPYLFAGREYDAIVGVYYSRARFYDPVLGRFLQPDPSRYSDGLNLYAYVGGNPINFVDPLGLFRASSGFGALDAFQAGLDTLSLGLDASVAGAPFSFIPDLANAGISLGRGDFVGAGLSAGAAIPFLGATGNAARLARVVDARFAKGPRLAGPGASDAFVTSAGDISGITNSDDLARRLTLLDDAGNFRQGPFAVHEFDAPVGVASPINRTNPGFVGQGRTAGGASEFVVDNLRLDELQNLSTRVVP